MLKCQAPAEFLENLAQLREVDPSALYHIDAARSRPKEGELHLVPFPHGEGFDISVGLIESITPLMLNQARGLGTLASVLFRNEAKALAGGLRRVSVTTALRAQSDDNKGPIDDGTYFIVSVYKPNMVIDLPTEHTHDYENYVQHYNGNGGASQMWEIRADPSRPKRYTINLFRTGHYLDIDDRDNDDGTEVHFHEREDVGYQAWLFEDRGGGSWSIKNDGSGKVIDYWSDDDGAGGHLRQKSWNGASQQRWKLQKAL